MKVPVKTLDNTDAGEIELDDAIFGLDPRRDILHRMVNWQLAKRRAGTHKTKTGQTSEVRGEALARTVPPEAETGSCRQGTARSAAMRGGGPSCTAAVPRTYHGFDSRRRSQSLGSRHAFAQARRDGKA